MDDDDYQKLLEIVTSQEDNTILHTSMKDINERKEKLLNELKVSKKETNDILKKLKHYRYTMELPDLEIGSYKPADLSNTYKLYLEGWRGVCIDGNPSLKREWLDKRPQDIFINTFVTDKKKSVTYSIFPEKFETMNSIDPQTSLRYAQRFKKSEIQKKQFLAIRNIFKLLSIEDKEVKYDKAGKPIFSQNKILSISHSGNYAAVIISDQSVGIDIEKIVRSIKNIASTKEAINFYVERSIKKYIRFKGKVTILDLEKF